MQHDGLAQGRDRAGRGRPIPEGQRQVVRDERPILPAVQPRGRGTQDRDRPVEQGALPQPLVGQAQGVPEVALERPWFVGGRQLRERTLVRVDGRPQMTDLAAGLVAVEQVVGALGQLVGIFGLPMHAVHPAPRSD